MPNVQTNLSKIDDEKFLSRYLLPYQVRWAADHERLKAWEKSIRIGATWVQEFVACRDRQDKNNGDYLHSSVTQDVALQFIEECKWWMEAFDIVAQSEGELNWGEKQDEKAFFIRFDTGQRIISFSSSPRAVRGFGGNVGLDEIAFHQDMGGMLKAAGGRAMWGFGVSLWSSHNGEDSDWNRLLQEERAKGDASKWSIHRTTIHDAVADGLVEKINQVRGTNFTREGFIEDTISLVGGQESFDEECGCEPKRKGTPAVSWLDLQWAQQDYGLVRIHVDGDARKHDTIDPCVQALLADRVWDQLDPAKRYSIGYDVARKGHLSAIWVNELAGKVRRLVMLATMHNCKFGSQREFIKQGMRLHRKTVGAGDNTGLGMQVCEELETEFGDARFIGMNFSAMKPYLGTLLSQTYEDHLQIIPRNPQEIAFDIRGIKTETTAAGRAVYTESRNPANPLSHCDEAWANALALAAAEEGVAAGEARGDRAPRREDPFAEPDHRDGHRTPDNSSDWQQSRSDDW